MRDLPNYIQRQKNALDELVQVAVNNKIDVFLVTGDLFNKNNPTEEERNLILNTLSSILIKLPGIVVIILEGNHDWNTQDVSMLDGLYEAYSPMGSRIHIVRNKPEKIIAKHNTFICIPCTQNLTKSGIKHTVKKLHKNSVGDTYVAMHEGLKSYSESGKQLQGESLPKLSFVKCWILGDTHKHQFLMPNAWYSGSLLQVNFGEKSIKGCILVTDGRPKFIPIKSPTRLVTVMQGEDVPDNCLAKCKITNPLEFNKYNVKDNVVSFEQDIREEKAIKLDDLTDITDGLPEILSSKFGYSRKQQHKAVKYIKKLVDK